MTLLVAWVGVDTHGPSSMYIASDSRISWGAGVNFDQGRKVFAFSKHPDILGYCGDVLFPSIALNQIVQLADAGLLFKAGFTAKEKFQAIVKKLNHLCDAYPKLNSGLAANSLQIIYASREISNNKQFFCHSISWSKGSGWKGSAVELPLQSGILFALGTGSVEFKKNYQRYQSGLNKSTSRNVFHCFCDTMRNISDRQVGGAPQIVGLYRKPDSPAVNFGVIYMRSRHFLGAKIDDLRDLSTNVEWRNENFELCDGSSMAKFKNAQPQPDPMRRL
ncbi:hypothetical protein ACPCYX_08205 [Pseudomonas fluorescens]|uniref:hypothetical protein n=1 Tax=Pseudomonas fluorescens TaxID=294 RepID=UPI003C1AA5F0